MKKETAGGETATQAFQLHNPIKPLNKSLRNIEEAHEQLANAGSSPENLGGFTIPTRYQT